MNNTISKRIKTLRVDKGFSQEQMADFLHISQSAYSRIENGESNGWVNCIDNICNIFEIKPEELFIPESLVHNHSENISASAVQNNSQHDTHITIINNLSDKIIELYEEKMKWLEERNKALEEEIMMLKNKG